MKIALIQTEFMDGQPAANLAAAVAAIEANPGADLYLLPELWSTGYAHDAWAPAADGHTPAALDRLQGLSATTGAAIGGSLVSRGEDGRLVNRFWLLDGDGPRLHYDKIHLFEPLREHELMAPGRRPGLVPFRGETIHLSICFDLRFPEQYRAAAVKGVRLFLVVAEWPEPRQHILSALAQARAMENQAYVVLCNRVGPSADGLMFPGQSAVYGPDGGMRLAAGDRRGVFQVDLDLGDSDELRARLPVLDRRVAGLDY
jgi:predicted amidohydrolase